MKWAEIIEQVRDRLQEESEAFFSDGKLMDIARQVQAEVAAVAECLEQVEERSVSAGVVEYALPDDCLNVLCATCDDYPLSRVDFRRVRMKVYPSGQPACFYVFGGYVGLYPAPGAAGTLRLWYSQRPPLGGFTLTHSGAGGATAATAAVSGGSLALTVTGGTYAGTDTFDLDAPTFDTITEVIDGISALGKGWTAERKPGCRASEPAANLEVVGATSAFQKEIVMDLAVKLPEEFQPLIELGTIYRAMWKDTEYEAGQVYKREYLERLDAMRRIFGRRGSRSGPGTVWDVYGGRTGAAGIKVFIP